MVWLLIWLDLKKKCIPLVNAKHHFGGKYYLSVVIISLLSISLQSPGSLGWFSSVGVKNYSLIIPGLARTQAMLFHDATKTQTKAICPYNTLAEIFEVWVDSLWLMQWGAKKETERNFSAELHMSLFGLQYCWELRQAEVQTGAKAADKADAFNQHRLHWLFICLRCGDCLWVILNSAVYLPSALSVVLCLCQSLIESFCSQI